MGPAKLDYQHGRHAELPWPVILPGRWQDGEGTADWALAELERIGIVIPAHLRGPARQVIAYVYETGYGDG